MIFMPSREVEILDYVFGPRSEGDVPWLKGCFHVAVKTATWKDGDAEMATKALIQHIMHSGCKNQLAGWSLTEDIDDDGVRWNKLMALGIRLTEKASA